MDDDEDFEALFFSEARELLDELVEHLNLLADNEGSEETVHAAFRAVHSVKGGAAAFGFDQLIKFAHIFETVMDLIREGSLDLTDDIAQTLLRSGDMMQVLVEMAQAGEGSSPSGIGKLTGELEVLAGQPASGEESSAEPEEQVSASEGASAATAEIFTDSSEDEAEGEKKKAVIRFTPEPAFLTSGHDPLRVFRSAKKLGLTHVEAEGVIPEISNFDPAECPIGWEMTFEYDTDISPIQDFFEIYSHAAQIEYIEFEDDEDDDEDDGGANDPDKSGSGSDGTQTSDGTAGGGTSNTDVAAKSPDQEPEELPIEKPKAQPRGQGGDASKSLRVELTRIDRLVNLVGEMLITQAAIAQQTADRDGHTGGDLSIPVETMSRQLRELQESVMAIRAQPVKSVFRRMPRVVRDLADKLGKDARLELYGEHTEVDATVIEELSEPLTHMLRNAMDHGLESNDERDQIGKPRVGRIKLSAEHHGERVIITVEDDGRGVNRERVREKAIERGLVSADDTLPPEEIDNLIFHPGFSTAQQVSSVSGRGVGMDVVKKKIVSLGGRCSLISDPGKGTKFVITLPLTLAVMDGMTICLDGQKYILPLSTVVEALHVERSEGKPLPDGSILLERRGDYLRLVSLRAALDLPPDDRDREMAIVVDTETTGHVALIVDELIDQRQIVLKSLETNFKQVEGVSGATILGDGQVALILDVPSLIQKYSGDSFFQGMMH